MRIIFVSNNYTPYSGGIVSAINASIGELQRQGHEVTLITLNFLGQKHADPPWVRRIPSLIRFRFKKNYMAIPWRPYFYMRQWITALKPDVIHCHHPFLLGPIAIRIAKELGIKKVFTYHTIYQAYAHYLGLPLRITQPIIERWVLSFCKKIDHILAPSRGVKDYLKDRGVSNVTVVPSGVQEFFLEQPFIKKEVKKPYQLLYVGRFVPEKNIPFLLDVMALLPDEYHLSLVGYGEYTESLKKYAYTNLGLSPERIHFLIQPDKAALIGAYHAAHLFLFASQTDTQGLVLVEAMACATPVIALDGFGQRDVIKEGKNGFMVTSRTTMKYHIKNLLANADRYFQMQQGAYQTAQNYEPVHLLNKVLQVYAGPQKGDL